MTPLNQVMNSALMGNPNLPPSRSQISPPSPPGGNSSLTKRANRTRFTDYQIKVLQEFFEQNAYPKDDDLDHLSKLLGLSPRVIVVWFQNARQKARKNYENQPPLDMSEDGTRYQRTPGLNYQCKKCLTVFQRYYELIRHQKTHCYKDSQSLPNSGDSSGSLVSPTNSMDGIRTSEPVTPSTPVTPVSTSKLPESKPTTPVTPTPTATEYKCEKCTLTFPRFDLWREHQNIHMMNPNLFSKFSGDSAFAMLQNVAQQQQAQAAQQQKEQEQHHEHELQLSGSSISQDMIIEDNIDSPSMKRRVEGDEDDLGDQPRDKRLRTTILPEQLDYLYQSYQVDCNPSRKQLENIAMEVGLKKRVVQVWFQNTRARERKGQYRAHQQLIHKRCPFCRALFRARSALESHLATKHPEEMAKGEVNIDSIPDDTMSASSSPSTSMAAVAASSSNSLDMNKLLANPYNMPNPFMPIMPQPGQPGLASPSDPVQLNMKRLYEDSLKKYLEELSGASHQVSAATSASATPEPPMKSPRPSSYPLALTVKREDDDAPLDLSKPLKVTPNVKSASNSISGGSSSKELFHTSPRIKLDESMSETMSESTDNNDMDSNPASPMSLSNSQKRFRTQMSNQQVKIMKNLFCDYKTPTMAECETLGREIGLPKRVIQVWFQNARAKEKKSKLNYSKVFGTELDFSSRPPEDCKLCNFKYSHKYTIQDHIFTHRHIEHVRACVQGQGDSSSGSEHIDATTMGQIIRNREVEKSTGGGSSGGGSGGGLGTHSHLAHLQALGLNAASLPGKN